MDAANRERLRSILRRESHSLFQYLREVPAWVGIHDRNALARMRQMANAELEIIEELPKHIHKGQNATAHVGAFPDFTPYNDAALHYVLPIVVREQKQLLAELERDRLVVDEADAGPILDRLLALKRQHGQELESLHTTPHSVTAVV